MPKQKRGKGLRSQVGRNDMSPSRSGLYRKFTVQRVDGKPKHDNCCYFVLDLDHDPHAAVALAAYAESCKDTHPELSAELSHGPSVAARILRPMMQS